MRCVVAVVAVCGVLIFTGVGHASTVTLYKQKASDTFNGGGRQWVNNISNRPGITALAGGFRLTDGIEDIIAWCLDVSHNLFLPGIYEITNTPFSDTTGTLSAAQIANIENLFEVNYATLDLSNSTSGKNQSAGFQLALWELLYETSGTWAVTGGSWFANSTTSALNYAAAFLANLDGPITQNYQLTFYESTQNGQNLVSVTPIPIPAALGMFLAAMASLIAWRRQKRELPKAAANSLPSAIN